MPGSVNPRNVVVGIAAAWIQPYDATTPAALPADTVAKGADWGGNWYNLGATDAGWKLRVGTSTQEINIEEQSTPVLVLAEKHSFQVTGDLAEDTLQHARWAYGGGSLTTIAAGVGQPGVEVLTLQDNLDYWALGLETVNVNNFWRRYLLPICVVGSDVETTFRRAADKRTYNFQAEGVFAPDQFQVRNMVAVATG